jgi:hypothetical protein
VQDENLNANVTILNSGKSSKEEVTMRGKKMGEVQPGPWEQEPCSGSKAAAERSAQLL